MPPTMAEPLERVQLQEASDADLMARVRAGERHKDAVVNYLTRLTGSRDRAEDLGQETFLRLFRSAAGYVEQGYLRAYLFRIATNLVRSQERRERRQRLLLPLLGGEQDRSEASAHAGLLRQEMQRELNAAVALLPLRYRVPLVLHEIEGWSYADIAVELDCREGTIKSRIHRGRQSLKRQLETYWFGGRPSWKRKG
jgi:RNA polymerase sigma-70 factor, ECF subfamily